MARKSRKPTSGKRGVKNRSARVVVSHWNHGMSKMVRTTGRSDGLYVCAIGTPGDHKCSVRIETSAGSDEEQHVVLRDQELRTLLRVLNKMFPGGA